MAAAVPLSLCKSPNFLIPSTCLGSSSFLRNAHVDPFKRSAEFRRYREKMNSREKRGIAYGMLLPVDPWAPNVDSQSIASQLFAFSLFPYIGFLYFITKSKSAPKLTLFGFYFLLAFVGATIPAGIYAKVRYGTSLSNVDWLHGGAESLLTLTNLFIVLGLREALRKAAGGKEKSTTNPGIKEDN
ncbi:1-acyl-sn-glycerol-3-phosphate acyltransferase [Quillaja saponaria]|uniref:1-acyl-sn-glycerol-3-phosphate acyltransferase n=1 Tax=Quillaja saponaria TaxID=32244 RepID=A0AAD7P7I4_QUISA|nr:1-acyl-sn-glycerol-3-phosphate acyltransferase [Quillaja saponaria]